MILTIEPTNACNLKCLHCMCDKLEVREFLPLEVVQKVTREARSYGLSHVGITGGEPTLHPQLDELLDVIAGQGFRFQMTTNGFRFKSRVLPILLKPHIRRHLRHISISLDGASARTHDANRGEGAFTATMEMVALCKLKGIPFDLITVINNFNKTELTDIALLGSGLGAISHFFGPLKATPLSVRQGIVPSPEDTRKLISFVSRTLANAFKMRIATDDDICSKAALLGCRVSKGEHIHVDYQGNAVFCYTLSHPVNDGKPYEPGEELLADLRSESLGAAIVRQKLLEARRTQERLRAVQAGVLTELDHFPCYWCMKRFSKLDWLVRFPDSPWAEAPAEPSQPMGELVAANFDGRPTRHTALSAKTEHT